MASRPPRLTGFCRPAVRPAIRAAGMVSLLLAAAGSRAGTAGAPRDGERFTFHARWGFVQAGRLTLDTRRDGDLWRFTGAFESTPVVDAFYKIRSRVESRARADSFACVTFFEDRREGGHRYLRFTELDFAAKRGLWTNYESGNAKKLKLKKGPAADLLGAAHWVRSCDWAAGAERAFPVFSDGKYTSLSFRCLAAGTRRVGGWGPMPVVELHSSDILEEAVRKRGTMTVLMDAGPSRVPLEVRLKVSWGTVVLELAEALGVPNAPRRAP